MSRRRLGGAAAVTVAVSTSSAALATLYLGARLFGLTFAPFALIDWLARVTPGAALTASIDAMVRMIQSLGIANLSLAAKTAEQAAGVAIVFALLAASAALVYSSMPGRKQVAMLAGGAIGGVVGAALTSIIFSVRMSTGVADAIWTTAVLAAQGVVVGWARARLEPDRPVGGVVEMPRLGRRRVLTTLLGASAALTAFAAVLGRLARDWSRSTEIPSELWSATHELPNADAAVRPAPGTRPEFTPVSRHYRIDINTLPPRVDGSTWRLRVHGMVGRPVDLSLDEIRRRPAVHQFITLSCISNPVGGSLIGTTRWSGVPLRHVLGDVQPSASASHLLIRSADGFDEVVDLNLVRTDPRIMLTYEWDGAPLPVEHGFPLRIYIPDRYGMKQPKWIQEIEAIDSWRPGYWVRRGWDREARVKATSVIDTIALDMMNASGAAEPIPVGGIAYAGARGISRVELRVDDGEWDEAALRTPLSPLTWVVWRRDWKAHPGAHRFTVRCFDGAGRAQIEEASPPHPSGATELHTRSIRM